MSALDVPGYQKVEASRRRKHKFKLVHRYQHHSNNVLMLSTWMIALLNRFFFLFHICVKIGTNKAHFRWRGGGGEINTKTSNVFNIVPRRYFCCGSSCFVFWSRIFVLFEPYVRFHIFSSVRVTEWPPIGE